MGNLMKYEIIDKLHKDNKYLYYLRQNSYWYKNLNRSNNYYDKFIKEMKIKYKLRAIDKVDNIIDSVDLITKIIDISNE